MELPEVRPEERTPLVDALLAMVRQLLDRVAEVERANQELRDEVARLKGQKPRPDIKPSMLEATQPKPQQEGGKRPGSGKRPKTAELTIHDEVKLHLQGLPNGRHLQVLRAVRGPGTCHSKPKHTLPAGTL